MADHQKPEIKVLGDAGELILGNKPQEVIETDIQHLRARSD